MEISSSDESKTNDIVEQVIDGYWYSAFGKFIIDAKNNSNSIFKWTLRYTRSSGTISSVSVGIVSNGKYNTDQYCFTNPCDYEFYAWETAWRCTRNKSRQNEQHNYGGYIKDGQSIIIIELNLKNKTIRFFQNDKDLGIAFDNINMDLQYRLAASFAQQGNKLQIIDFVCEPFTNS